MQHILRIGTGVNVTPLALALKRNPQLWNEHSERTSGPSTPHKEVDDIWVRYARSLEEGRGPHESVWYEAANVLTPVKDIVMGVMSMVRGEQLGGVLITRVPPGGQVAPHTDHSWHAHYYDKFAVQIAAHPQQYFGYADGQFVTAPGDIFWFNNQEEHWVANDSPVERITMIICIRTDQQHRAVATPSVP